MNPASVNPEIGDSFYMYDHHPGAIIFFSIKSLYADIWVSNAFRQKNVFQNYCKQNICPTRISKSKKGKILEFDIYPS